MSNIEALINRFQQHKNITDAKFQFMLDRQRAMESAMLELKEESSDFYGFVAESLREIDTEIKSIKNKSKDLQDV